MQTSEPERESAYIIHPDLSGRRDDPVSSRQVTSVLEEARGLVHAIHLDVAGLKVVKISKIRPGHFLGKGQCRDIDREIKALAPDIVVFNGDLSPVQQRNLEREWNIKVIDRTGLILEIFGERAQTKEGQLQVDLAALEYQRSRLVRSWTHLERQRGGAGFMGGPGETQIEIDRRLIGDKITQLKKELEDVRRTRSLARKSREQVPFPVVALVGYTNAGKSTLFNTLTGEGVFAEDLPFATLDPTLRRFELPTGQKAILSDTVGFISNLPTHLIEAFQATLEQIRYADVIAHVIDASQPDYEAQRQDVIDILKDLGVGYEQDERIVEIYNKVDTLSPEEYDEHRRAVKFNPRGVLVSALKQKGLESLLEHIAAILGRHRQKAQYKILHRDGKALSWLYEHAEILKRRNLKDKSSIHVMIDPVDMAKFKEHYGYEPA